MLPREIICRYNERIQEDKQHGPALAGSLHDEKTGTEETTIEKVSKEMEGMRKRQDGGRFIKGSRKERVRNE